MLLLRRNRKNYLKHKELARVLVHARILYFNQFYNVPLRKIFIKNHKSRWGSCSEKGNLNFNYKLAFLPPHLVDYIVVHELCHLHHFNHSPSFWALVAQTLPNHKALRLELRRLEQRRIA
ncbi:MAG TPA: M48 family metallopeptidase [Candidatus Paceibacterota bacterium]|nr:M48 family metallopeptidase [Candidatus Paceibacterota bacterium]